jgi:hypothetical protein
MVPPHPANSRGSSTLGGTAVLLMLTDISGWIPGVDTYVSQKTIWLCAVTRPGHPYRGQGLRPAGPEELSRDELIALVREQAGQLTAQADHVAARDERIAAQDGQITTWATQVAELMEANEALVARLAKLEHLLSRNSGNSSSPPSKDDDPGKTPP